MPGTSRMAGPGHLRWPLDRVGVYIRLGKLAGAQGLNGLADAFAVGRIGLRAVGDVPLDGGFGSSLDGARGVLEEHLLLLGGHLLAEEDAGLLEVVGVI